MSTVLGLIALFLFVVAVILAAAGVTWVVVRLFPTTDKKKPQAEAS